MSTATKPRTKVKPARTIALLVPLNASGTNGLFRITETKGKRVIVDEYFVEKVPADFGEGFLVEKRDYGGPRESRYHVLLTNDQDHTCECPGHVYKGHCRHCEGIQALRQAGKL